MGGSRFVNWLRLWIPSFSPPRPFFLPPFEHGESKLPPPSRLRTIWFLSSWQKSLSLCPDRWRDKWRREGFDDRWGFFPWPEWKQDRETCRDFNESHEETNHFRRLLFAFHGLELESNRGRSDDRESGRKWKRGCARCITIPFTIISRIAFSVLHLNFSPCFFLFHSSSWKDTCRKISSGIWNASMDVGCLTSSTRPETLSINTVEKCGHYFSSNCV